MHRSGSDGAPDFLPPAGLHGMMAVRAGARHATLAQRWLYLSMAAHEAAAANGFGEDQACSWNLYLSFRSFKHCRSRIVSGQTWQGKLLSSSE